MRNHHNRELPAQGFHRLHHGLLARHLGLAPESWAKGGSLVYTREGHEVPVGLTSGDFAAAFVLPRPDASEVVEVAATGSTMPQKSTYFHPKVLTGLAFHELG